MTEETSLEMGWRTFENIREWIVFSDAKAGAVVAANGVIIAVLALFRIEEGWFLQGVLLLTIVLSVVSITLASLAVLPNLNVGESRSVLFFAHIAKRRPVNKSPDRLQSQQDEFVSEFSTVMHGPSRLLNELGSQVWANAEVAWRKYRYVTFALRFFIATVIGTGILIVSTLLLQFME